MYPRASLTHWSPGVMVLGHINHALYCSMFRPLTHVGKGIVREREREEIDTDAHHLVNIYVCRQMCVSYSVFIFKERERERERERS